MIELGKYAANVFLAYGVSIFCISVLLSWSLLQSRKSLIALSVAESEYKTQK